MTKITYRADIDGLRAVAVLSVIIYHAFPQALPGGFSGVDIFFVISGYLISGILYKGVDEGSFNFLEFYSRRIRRLFPALLTVMIACLVYGHFTLLTDEYTLLGKHAAAGTIFIQNIVFWKESGYFDTEGSLKPLLHLWSLAVEEQFYIVFPPLLLLLWRCKQFMVKSLTVLLLISFVANVIESQTNDVSDFFLTQYRAWEFLAGALLSWWNYYRNPHKQHRFGDILSIFGALLLLLSMTVIHKSNPYPGWRALLPVVGSVMLIGAGRQALVNRHALAFPVLVWIGLISYPLYLFHWPLLSFVHIFKGEKPKPAPIVAAVALSFILAAATYYFIEKRVRYSRSRWTVPLLALLFVLVGATGLLISKGKVPSATISPEVEKVQRAIIDKNYFENVKWIPGKPGICINKFGGDGKKTLFIGDSNIQQYSPRILELLTTNASSRGALMVSTGGVIPINGISREGRFPSAQLFESIDQILKEYPEIDRVVIGARWDLYFRKKGKYNIGGVPLSEKAGVTAALESFDATLKELAAAGKKLTLVLAVPTGPELDPKNMIVRSFWSAPLVRVKSLSKEKYLGEFGGIHNQLAEVGRTNGAIVIDPLDFLCDAGNCISINEEGPIRFDGSHLRPSYVRKHLFYLDEVISP